jgi:hypothetical protein
VSDSAACELCGSQEQVQTYALTVDGVALRLAPLLCRDHGERLVSRSGMLLASLDKPIGEVFRGL